MTVRELIAKLQTADPDSVVYLSRDAEGNGFSPLFSVGEGLPATPTATTPEPGPALPAAESEAGEPLVEPVVRKRREK